MDFNLASITQFFRLPSVCTVCYQYHKGTLAVCEPCQTLLTPLVYFCKYCALPLPNRNFLICGQCSQKKPYFDRAMAAYLFEEPLRSLLHEFKYRDGLYLTSFITSLMLKTLTKDFEKPQCLIPVPMHPKRLQQRGFNHSAEMVKRLGKILDIPYELSLCSKIYNTAPQAGLDGKQRKRNLHNVFSAKANSYRHVMIIDDLITTGSTSNELTRALRKTGIERVEVWSCARAAG